MLNEFLFLLLGALGALHLVRYKSDITLKSEFKQRRAAAVIDVFSKLDEIESLISGLNGLYHENKNVEAYEANQHASITKAMSEFRVLIAQSRFLIGEELYRLAQGRSLQLIDFYKNTAPNDKVTEEIRSRRDECIQALFEERFEIIQKLPKGIYKD